VDFGTDLYKLSLTSLETTRLEAFRKMKSLVVISSAQPAQEAVYPRRYYIVFSALLICGLFYGLIRLMLSVIRDHRD
jgi:capsular polysaccharide transport system permease protein